MATHPVNLAVRFLLELSALAALGVWGWRSSDGWVRLVFAAGLPLLAAAVWGVFAVPNDPTRSGNAPVAVPGAVRLALEGELFACAAWMLADMELTRASWILIVIVVLHYMSSYDRIQWLVHQ